MPKENLAEDTLKKIEEDKIKPTPRWCFATKNYLFWLLFAVFVLFSSVALSDAIFLFKKDNWSVHQYLGRGFFKHFFVSMPYFWIILAILFLLLINYILRKTECGYKYDTKKAVGLEIVAVVVFALVIFFVGLSSIIHQSLLNRTNFYDAVIYDENKTWDNPNRGLISGRVVSFDDQSGFFMVDRHQENWHVFGPFRKEPPNFLLGPGVQVRVIGRMVPPGNNFMANIVKQCCH